MRRGRGLNVARSQGFTFVMVLATVAVIAIVLSVAGPTWAQQSRRERERELLRVGALYAAALAEFREASPGTLKTFPKSLDELTLDKRFFGVHRHLRQLYLDPIDPSRPWGLVRDIDGYIIGVYSQSDEAPIAEGILVIGATKLGPANRYSDWKFAPVIPS